MNDTTKQTALPSHTPGPWHTATAAHLDNVGGRDVAVVDQANYIIAEAFEIVGHGEHRSAKANARLIAAAPDMLNALEIAIATIERLSPQHRSGGFCSTRGTLDVCQAAIDKARGTNA